MAKSTVKRRLESFIPDEIVVNILSRLHPKDVLRCRCVAKGWRDLTSTPHFVDLHKQHGIVRMVLVDVPGRKRDLRDQYFLDEWWITERKKPPVQKIYGYPLNQSEYSHDGLLVMRIMCECCEKIVIINPIFREKVKIIVSNQWRFWLGMIYGVYFNPTLKEYCALVHVTLRSSYPTNSPMTYKMLTLGLNPCLIDIRNPYTYATRNLLFKRPAMVDGYLYWLIKFEDRSACSDLGDIMEFDTRNDEFRVMRCPTQMNDDYGRSGLDLLNIDGFLTLVHLAEHQRAVLVNLLTLKDRASELWTGLQYYVDDKVVPERRWMRFETIDVRCGEILIRSDLRLYVCILERGAAKVLGGKTYKKYPTFVSHDVCLSSLKNCKPVIHIGNRKKCRECEKLEKDSAMNEQSDVMEEIVISAFEEGVGSSSM